MKGYIYIYENIRIYTTKINIYEKKIMEKNFQQNFTQILREMFLKTLPFMLHFHKCSSF